MYWCKKSHINLHSIHCSTASSNTSLGFPLLPHAAPPVPSTCRPPLCRWVDRSPQQRLSAPDVFENVHLGPASQSASTGGPSWWCLSVPSCRPQPPRRSTSPWDQRGPGCGRPLVRPGMARRGNVEAGMGVGQPRYPSHLRPLPGTPRWACPASWSLGCPARPHLHQRRGVCDTRVGSRRCEGESGLGSVMKVVGHWGCWTLRWRAPDCRSCYPEDKNKDKNYVSWLKPINLNRRENFNK